MSGKPLAWYPSMTVVLFPSFDSALTRLNAANEKVTLFAAGEERRAAIVSIVPRTASVELPSPRQAAKFSIEVDWRDLPVDPRTMSACAVEIHLGVVEAAAFAEGMFTTDTATRPPSVLLPVIDNEDASNNTLVFVGSADSWKVTHNSGGGVVAIEGRDLRGILLDSPLDASTIADIDLRQPIDAVVQAMLATHPIFGPADSAYKIVVSADPAAWKDGIIPSPAVAGGLTRVNQGARGDKAQPKGSVAGSKLNYWDLITQYCFLVGTVPEFHARTLQIRPAYGLFQRRRADQGANTTGSGLPPTPFARGAARYAGGEALRVRRMVYGTDIADLTLERKLNGRKAQPIEVVGYDVSAKGRGLKKLLRVRYPDDPPVWKFPKKTAAKSGSGHGHSKSKKPPKAKVVKDASERPLIIPFPGYADVATLRRAAKAAFEEIMRGELKGAVKTRDLTSFGGSAADADLVRLRPGDAIELRTAKSHLEVAGGAVGTFAEWQSSSFEAAVAEVAARVNSVPLAKVIVSTARRDLLVTPFFYINAVKFDWEAGTGLGVAFDFTNYLEPDIDAAIRPDSVSTRRAMFDAARAKKAATAGKRRKPSALKPSAPAAAAAAAAPNSVEAFAARKRVVPDGTPSIE